MKSKVDRLTDSIDNMFASISFYLNNIRDKYYSNNVSKKDYLKTEKDLMELSLILTKLKPLTIEDNKKIEEIRRLHLSNLTLYEQGDYDYLFDAISKVNHEFYKDAKDVDKRRVSEFKSIFNHLPAFYQNRLRKAQITSENNIDFGNKKVDNYAFFTEKYMQVKYGFKKIKYNVSPLSPMNLNLIDECNNIIKSNKKNNTIKDEFTTTRDTIAKYASYEIIIDNLKKIILLCDELDYYIIKNYALKLIEKYQRLSRIGKEKYNECVRKVIGFNNSDYKVSKIEQIESLKEMRDALISEIKNEEESGMKL